MEQYYLQVQWHYDYDKEGTWFDKTNGENAYLLVEGATYSLPQFSSKTFVITSAKMVDGRMEAEVYIDYHTVTVTEGKGVVAHASHSYCAGGDAVEESMTMTLNIVKK